MPWLFIDPQSVRARWVAAALALAPLAVLAQAMPQGGDAADPKAFAPPTAYRSVFADTPTGVESANVPWRQANDAVGQFERGHMDVIKWEAANPGVSSPPAESAPRAAGAPPAAVSPMPGPMRHDHHGGAKE